MVSYSSPKRKLKTAGAGKRVIVCFGPPSSGVSTIVDCLKKSSELSIEVVPYLGEDSIKTAEEALNHSEIVFLDVDGGVFGPEDVQRIVDNRLVYTGSGAFVRFYTPDEDILHRTADVSPKDLTDWAMSIPEVEARIRTHNVNYFMLSNFDLVEAVKQLALRSNVSR